MDAEQLAHDLSLAEENIALLDTSCDTLIAENAKLKATLKMAQETFRRIAILIPRDDSQVVDAINEIQAVLNKNS